MGDPGNKKNKDDIVEKLKEALDGTSQKPPDLVIRPNGPDGKWIDANRNKIMIVIGNKGGDVEVKGEEQDFPVKLIFVDGYNHGQDDNETDEPQEKPLPPMKYNQAVELEFEMPNEDPFDPDFPIEIIVGEGEDWRITKTVYIKKGNP